MWTTILNTEKTRLFLYSKLAITILPLLLLLEFYGRIHLIPLDIVFFSVAILLLSAIFWWIVYLKRPFRDNIAQNLFLIDSVIIFLFLYPAFALSKLFILLPVIYLLIGCTLFSERALPVALISFFSLFVLAAVVYGILNVFAQPVQTSLAHLSLLGLIASASTIATRAYRNLQEEQDKFHREKTLFQKRYDKLEHELTLTRQHSQILDKDVRKRDIEIKNILTLSGQLNVREDSRKILTSFLLTAIGQIGASHAAILARESRDHNYISIIVQKGLRGIDPTGIRLYLHSNLLQLFNSVREPILLDQIPRQDLYEDEIKILQIFEGALVSPIHIRNAFTGLLFVGSKISNKPFTKEDINLVSIIANQTAFVLEQSKLTQDYKEFYAKTIRAMLESLEAKFMFGRGHNVRTANYANMVAQRMQLSAREIKDLTYGSLLHDIGKIAIKDEYLLNSSTFQEDDTNLKEKILDHTVEGSKILKAAGFNHSIIDLALHHHEFYNGKGYPHQIGENDIALSTRILAVCNAYDAMTSDRPYRKALPASTARQYLQQRSNSQFDPEIVKIFLEEIDKAPGAKRLH